MLKPVIKLHWKQKGIIPAKVTYEQVACYQIFLAGETQVKAQQKVIETKLKALNNELVLSLIE